MTEPMPADGRGEPGFLQRKRRAWPWVLAAVIGIGLFFMILVPSMCAPRPAANRMKSVSNLRQIGMGLSVYADTNQHVFPHDFAELVLSTELTPDVFVSPLDNDAVCADGPTASVWGKALLDPAGHHCSYRYVAAGVRRDALRPDDLLAYEPIEKGDDQEGVQLLYADGHVDWQLTSVGSAARTRYDKLLTDDAAGVRPLSWPQ